MGCCLRRPTCWRRGRGVEATGWQAAAGSANVWRTEWSSRVTYYGMAAYSRIVEATRTRLAGKQQLIRRCMQSSWVWALAL
jgi:hypothetical protein